MRSLTTYELVGIVVSIVVAVVVLGMLRGFPTLDGTELIGEAEQPSDIVFVDPSAEDQSAALARAIVDGSTRDGDIRSIIAQDPVVGAGREVRAGDTVTVHYIGLVKDGGQFDDTYERDAPFSFTIGAGEAIDGLERGVVGMKEGGERILIIPSSMAYGRNAVGPVPPNATLIFAVELLSID